MCRTNKSKENNMRVELKYCEHCGALWVREGGGGVYCGKCEPKVADLAISKKRPGRLILPKQEKSVVEMYGGGIIEQVPEPNAVGGVA